jgi:membrane protein required for colicin V production
MVGPLTYLDLALIALAAISGLLAMYRGFARELLSILSWAIAGISVIYFVLNYKKMTDDIAQQMGAPPLVAQVVTGAVIFLIVLIVVHLITSRLSDAILDSRVGMIDRILGLLFGLFRGFILVVIPFMLYESFIPDTNAQLPWVRDAKSLPYIKGTGDAIRSVLVNYVPSSLTAPPAATEPPPQEQQ